MVPSTQLNTCRFGAVLTYKPPGSSESFGHNGQKYFTTGPEREELRQAYAKFAQSKDKLGLKIKEDHEPTRIKRAAPEIPGFFTLWRDYEEAEKELRELQARLAAQASNGLFSIALQIPRSKNRDPEAMVQALELLDLLEPSLPTIADRRNPDSGNPFAQGKQVRPLFKITM